METEHDYCTPAQRRMQREKCFSGESKILWLVGVSIGVLCIIQAALNVALRLNSGGCSNTGNEDTTSDFAMASAEQIKNLTSEIDQLLLTNDWLERAFNYVKFQLQNQRKGLPEQQPPVPLAHLDDVVIRSSYGLIAAPRGSSVKLSCEVFYYFEFCDLLHVVWFNEEGAELTDPRKYSTTVSHSRYCGNAISTQVVTEILRLTTEDSGRYQCVATCGENVARGRNCQVDVSDGSSD